MKPAVVLEHKEIYHDRPKSISEIIDQLPKNQSLSIISEYNAKLFQFENNQELQSEILKYFRQYLTLQTKYNLNKYLSKLKKENCDFIFFSNLSSIILINNLVFSKNTETRELYNSEIELLFEAYLLCSEVWTKRQSKYVIEEQDDYTKIKKFITSNISLSEFMRTRFFNLTLIKSIYLFKFLSQEDSTKLILMDFLDSFNCNTWQAYLKKIITPVISLITPNSTSKSKINTINSPIEINNFLDKLCININNPMNENEFDFFALRNFPLFKFNESSYLFLSYHFVFNKMFDVPIFNISNIAVNKNIYKDRMIARKEIFSEMFYEKYFLEEICKKFSSFKWIKIEYLYNNNIYSKDSIPDLLIHCPNCIFVVEFKDILLGDGDKTSFDPDRIEKAILSKLWKNKEGTYKGAGQILRYINNAQILKNINKKKIYPILIVTDRSYCRSGINLLISKHFINELNEDRRNNTQNLTIINIDSILEIIDLLLKRPVLLKKLIDEYHKRIRSETDLFKKSLSFDDFVEKKISIMKNISILKNAFIDIIKEYDEYQI